MGNITEGKTYVKGTHRSLPPNVSSQIDNYKSHIRISTASNIYSQNNLSLNMPSQSKIGTARKLADDITQINDQGYNQVKYKLKKMPFNNKFDMAI